MEQQNRGRVYIFMYVGKQLEYLKHLGATSQASLPSPPAGYS